jgi:tetratricopeptide (TPR) repeat protein
VFDGDELTIPSDLVAEVVWACTPADARRELHARCLAAHVELGLSASSSVIARHAECAGDMQRAYEQMMAAGDDAVYRFDDDGAASWYGRALAAARELLAGGEPTAVAQFADASVRLADVLRHAGRLGLAAGTLDEAELMQPQPVQAACIARARGRLALTRGDFEDSCYYMRYAIGLGLRAGDSDFVCETYVDLAKALSKKGDPAAAAAELNEGIDMLTLGEGLGGAASASRLWLLGYRLAELYQQAGDASAAERVAQDALHHADRALAPQGRGRLFALLARINEAAGHPKRALAHRARAIDELRRIGDRRSTAELLLENARATMDLGPIAATQLGHGFDGAAAGATRIARELAAEIGWDEGAAMAAQVESSWTVH